MQLKVFLEGNHMVARTFRKKKVFSFSAFFSYVYTNVDNRERLERVIENSQEKNMESQSGGERMRNASGQQGENERQ